MDQQPRPQGSLPMFYMLPYFGDTPEDHEAIALGIKWHEEGFCDE